MTADMSGVARPYWRSIYLSMTYLLKPLKVRSMNLANRLVMPPMATAKAEPDGKVSQALLDYYALPIW